MRKAYGMTLIALMLAGVGYMFYMTAPVVWAGLTTAAPGDRTLLIIVLTLGAIIVVCRTVVAVLSRKTGGKGQ